MGYEMAATPLQLAAAYGAVANGGLLLEPALVREVRAPDGTVRYRHAPRVVRRVMPPRVAGQVRAMLKSVVDSGTATGADLANFTVGGKSGTVRRIERGRGYAAGHYNAVFAGIFPVEDPQFVIVVKLENPSGVYYGGKIAAPVTKVVLEAALAARDAALDRAALADRVEARARDAYTPKPDTAKLAAERRAAERRAAERRATQLRLAAARGAGEAAPDSAERDSVPPVLAPELRRDLNALPAPPANPVRAVVELGARDVRPQPAVARVAAGPPRAVPPVRGLPLRDAVVALHRAGFRVRVAGSGAPASDTESAARATLPRDFGKPVARTAPAVGTLAAPGALVTLYRTP
jgi:cell division protein FtsI (penicillin-binding protein 3)